MTPDYRVGFGTDLHRLREGSGLRLGGVWVPCAYSAVAVSDGDVVLHALVDAMLGACGLGDIGEYFPPARVAPGADSRLFVDKVLRMFGNGVEIVNVDCVIDLESVKLGGLKKEIGASIAGILGMDPKRVNVKAKTAEGVGPVGEGRAVASQVALLVRLGGVEAGT